MILVDDVGGFFAAINHLLWDGVTLADIVMSFFLFIVGVALKLAYKVNKPSYRELRKPSHFDCICFFFYYLMHQLQPSCINILN